MFFFFLANNFFMNLPFGDTVASWDSLELIIYLVTKRSHHFSPCVVHIQIFHLLTIIANYGPGMKGSLNLSRSLLFWLHFFGIYLGAANQYICFKQYHAT